MWVSYQRLNRAGLRRAQESVRPNYERAALVRGYQPKIVPGLLQTGAYTTAVLEDARERQGVGRDDIAEAVAERADQQKVLSACLGTSASPARCPFYPSSCLAFS